AQALTHAGCDGMLAAEVEHARQPCAESCWIVIRRNLRQQQLSLVVEQDPVAVWSGSVSTASVAAGIAQCVASAPGCPRRRRSSFAQIESKMRSTSSAASGG